MKAVQIRRGRVIDLPAVWQIASETGVYLPEVDTDFWVAENPTIVGFICSVVAVDELSLLGLAVAASARRQGIATALHAVMMTECRPAVAFLEVRASNVAAQALYQKWGYQTVGMRKNYYRTADGGQEHALVMRWQA